MYPAIQSDNQLTWIADHEQMTTVKLNKLLQQFQEVYCFLTVAQEYHSSTFKKKTTD